MKLLFPFVTLVRSRRKDLMEAPETIPFLYSNFINCPCLELCEFFSVHAVLKAVIKGQALAIFLANFSTFFSFNGQVDELLLIVARKFIA